MSRYTGLRVRVGVTRPVVRARSGRAVMSWFSLMTYPFGSVVSLVIVSALIPGSSCWKCGISDCECGVRKRTYSRC